MAVMVLAMVLAMRILQGSALSLSQVMARIQVVQYGAQPKAPNSGDKSNSIYLLGSRSERAVRMAEVDSAHCNAS